MNRREGYVLSLCDRTGNMVRPWLEAGYHAVTLDLQDVPNGSEHPRRHHLIGDVRALADSVEKIGMPKPLAVFAFPPCTHLAASGSRWWADKGLGVLSEALAIVHACQRIAQALQAPYVIENPVGALSTHWRKPDHQFDPADFAGYSPDPLSDSYRKKTCYWIGNGFIMPHARKVPGLGVASDHIHNMPQSNGRADKRSVTPLGFAYAVFDANCPEQQERRKLLEELRT